MWYPVFNSEYAPNKAEEMSTNYADAQIEKFNDADILVLTMPMWNYSVPAIMKAWIDQVLLPGKTFSINKEEGINGLHKIKRIVLLVSSGAAYKEDDDRDALSRQVRHAFEFVGINEIDVVWAEGQNPMFFDNAEESKSFAIEAAIEAAEDIAEMEI